MGCNLCHNLLSQHACTICLTFMHNMSNMHAQYVQHAQYAYEELLSKNDHLPSKLSIIDDARDALQQLARIAVT